MVIVPQPYSLAWFVPFSFLPFSWNEIAASRASSPGRPWNSGTTANVPHVIPKVRSSSGSNAAPVALTWKGATLKGTKTNTKCQLIFCYWLSSGTFGYAFWYSAGNIITGNILIWNMQGPYGCESWSLTLREERRLRVFENGVLRRMFGPNRDEVTGEWRKLHNEELKILYSSPNIVRVIKSRRMRCVGHVARMGEGRGVYRVLVGKPEGKRPLGRPRRKWEDNIRMDLQEVGLGYEDWIERAQDRDRWRALVCAVRNLRVP